MCGKMRRLGDYLRQIKPEFFCLLMVLGIDFLYMTFGDYPNRYFVENYLIMPTMVFVGLLAARKYVGQSRWQFLLGCVFCLWFMLVQFMQVRREVGSDPLGPVLSVFLLAFPFAGAAQDEENQYGLKLAGMVYVGACLALAGMSGLLLVGKLPGFLRHIVYMDGTRLYAANHPNMCAGIFMVGIGFSLAFTSLAQKRWMKLLLWGFVVVQLLLIVLTNSRTTLVMAMLLVAGYVFFWILNKYGWKRVLVALLVVAMLAGALLFAAVAIRQNHAQRQLEQYLAQENPDMSKVIVDKKTGEMKLRGSAGQNSFLEDLKTFNGRTSLWKGIVQAFRENPDMLLWGTHSTNSLYGRGYLPFSAHGHNAWMETWVRTGTPGLILALVFTGWTLWKAAGILLCIEADMWRKAIVLLMLCIMGAAFLEPYLFYTSSAYHYINSIFFLMLGYLTRWRTRT